MRESIGLVEFASIALGVRAADEMVKVAPVELLEAATIDPGRYYALVTGDVAAVDSSVRRGRDVGAETVVDSLFLPRVHPQVFPALLGTTSVDEIGAVGVLETFTIASAVLGADAAAKAATVELIELRLARGLGGKGFFTLTGTVADVTASIEAAERLVRPEGLLVRAVVIASPHRDLAEKLR
jgi:microcompartment protein CcmL/EutN